MNAARAAEATSTDSLPEYAAIGNPLASANAPAAMATDIGPSVVTPDRVNRAVVASTAWAAVTVPWPTARSEVDSVAGSNGSLKWTSNVVNGRGARAPLAGAVDATWRTTASYPTRPVNRSATASPGVPLPF